MDSPTLNGRPTRLCVAFGKPLSAAVGVPPTKSIDPVCQVTTSPESSSRTRRAGRLRSQALRCRPPQSVSFERCSRQPRQHSQRLPRSPPPKAQTLGQQAAAARTRSQQGQEGGCRPGKARREAKAHYLSLVARRNALAKRVNASSGPARRPSPRFAT